MNESVFNLIPEPYIPPEKQARHISKFRAGTTKLAPPNYTTFPAISEPPVDGTMSLQFRRPAANMGREVGPSVDPKTFLKKGEGVVSVIPAQPKQKLSMKAPLITEKPVMGLKTEKDFVASNVIEISNMPTKGRSVQPEPATSRPSFGKVPRYLTEVKGQIAAEKEHVATYKANRTKMQEDAKAEFVQQLSEERRQELVAQLKERWEEKHKQLLAMPFARDTMMQIARKEAVEKELTEIEQAIKKLEKKVVYVYADDPAYGGWAKSIAMQDAQKAATLLNTK